MSQLIETSENVTLFPPLTRNDVLACQFSSWYSTFEKQTIRARIIRPLNDDFKKFLEADGISVPEESDDHQNTTELSDEESDSDDDGTSDGIADAPRFSFPELTADIRAAIKSFGAVFPKLNWTSPRDASWMLAPSSPLKCTSPADVYLFLKSSDFVSHDLDPATVFEGCVDSEEVSDNSSPSYQLELVLKKWYLIETSRELRCFVRENILIGITQRDTTFYEFLNESSTNETIRDAVITFWNDTIKPWWTGRHNYVFDILLTRDFTRAHIIDFNPYAPRTDPLLFTYEELKDIYSAALLSSSPASDIPEFRVISSRAHPSATRSTPQHAHNMMPREALELSAGKSIYDFQESWADQLRQAMEDKSSDEGGEHES